MYPTSLDSVGQWAKDNHILVPEARTRFVQYTILRVVADSRRLRDALVFKGGNALDFVWNPNRSTADLDFSIDLAEARFTLDEAGLRTAFHDGLVRAQAQFNVILQPGRIDRQPPGEDRQFVMYTVRIRYALPDQQQFRRMQIDPSYVSPQMIPVDISIYEPICGTELVGIGQSARLRVSTLEDIVAEKLRALLQQPIRNRTRGQDLLDIAVVLRNGRPLDIMLVRDFLRQKAAAVGIEVSREAFSLPEIWSRARIGYDELRTTVRILFVPFEEARHELDQFLDRLEL